MDIALQDSEHLGFKTPWSSIFPAPGRSRSTGLPCFLPSHDTEYLYQAFSDYIQFCDDVWNVVPNFLLSVFRKIVFTYSSFLFPT
jgi:hypothetical protein